MEFELTGDQLVELLFDGSIEDERFEVVEEHDWIEEHKMSSKEFIFRDNLTNKHYKAEVVRSGDYWQGYEYDMYVDHNDYYEVEIKEVVIKKWVKVKGDK